MSYCLYIIYSIKWDQFYVGQTDDLKDRIKRHNEGRSKATRGGEPWRLEYTEDFTTRSEAMKREYEIKRKKSRRYIEWLIDDNRLNKE